MQGFQAFIYEFAYSAAVKAGFEKLNELHILAICESVEFKDHDWFVRWSELAGRHSLLDLDIFVLRILGGFFYRFL